MGNDAKKSASPFSVVETRKDSGGVRRQASNRKTDEAVRARVAQTQARYSGGQSQREASEKLFDALSQDAEFAGGSEAEELQEGADEQDEPSAVQEPEGDEPEESEGEEYEDEEYEVEGEEDLDEADDDYEVVVNGETQRVSLEELKAGYSRHADYTRKTQELAEQRKEAAKLSEDFQTRAQEYDQRLQLVQQVLAEQAGKEPNWEQLERENPAEYARQWAKHQQHREKMMVVEQERARVQQEYLADLKRQMTEHIESEREKLWSAVPEWSNPEARAQELSKLSEYAQRLGYSQEDLENTMDHRAVLMLRKAMLYDEMHSEGAKQRIRKKRKAHETLKPGARRPRRKRQQRSQEAREQLRRTGNVRDAARAIETMLSK